MALVFKAKGGHSTEIAGVGLLGETGAADGIPIEYAAARMSELQEKEKDGSLKLDKDGNPVPLTGKKLEDAAREFAEARGLSVAKISDEKAEKIVLGQAPGRPPAAEVSKAAYEKIYGDLEPEFTDPEEKVREQAAGMPAALQDSDDDKEGGS